MQLGATYDVSVAQGRGAEKRQRIMHTLALRTASMETKLG